MTKPQTDVGSKIQDLRPPDHKKCSVQLVGVDTSLDVPMKVYHCVNHNVNYKASIPASPPPQTEQIEDILNRFARKIWDTQQKEFSYHIRENEFPKFKKSIQALIREARQEAIASYKKVNKLLENEIRIDELETMRIEWLRLGDPECGIAIDKRITKLKEQG